MELNNFKELLLKKSSDNRSLQTLIKYMKDDYLVNHVVESLEKMAIHETSKRPNDAIKHFGANMSAKREGQMFRDAMSHHASHYKAALDSGNTKLADQHMKQIFKMLHLGSKLTRDGKVDPDHTRVMDKKTGKYLGPSKLDIEVIDPKPWERQRYDSKKPNGRWTTVTRGFARQDAKPNYDYLRGAPHESHTGEIALHGHNKAWPLKEIKINGKYLNIEDVGKQSEFVPHEFDHHPVMEYFSKPSKSYNSLDHSNFLDSWDNYYGPKGGIYNYAKDMKEKMQADPEGYKARGTTKPDAIHKDIPGLNISGKVEAVSAKPSKSSSADIRTQLAAITGKKTKGTPSKTSDIRAKLNAIKRGGK